MSYPNIPNYNSILEYITEYAKLKDEYGSHGVQDVLKDLEKSMKDLLEKLKELPIDDAISSNEPDDLSVIRTLEQKVQEKQWKTLI